MPSWFWSLLVLAAAVIVFLLAMRKAAASAADPLNVSLIDYNVIQLAAFVVGLFALVFTIYFLTGNYIHTRLN